MTDGTEGTSSETTAAPTEDTGDAGAAPGAPAAPSGEGDSLVSGPTESTETEVKWYDSLPEDLRNDPSIAKYHSGGLEALARGHQNLSKIQGVPADKISRVPDLNDDEGVREYFGKLGLPDTADDYQLRGTTDAEGNELPQGFTPDGDLAQVFARACFDRGLAPDVVQPIYDACNRYLFAATQEAAQGKENKRAKQIDTLERQYGGAFEQTIAAADFVAQELDIMEPLTEAGLGTDPRIVAALAKLAPIYSEHSGMGKLPISKGGTQTPAELNAKATELQAQALQLPQGDPRKRQLIEQALRLREQAG